MNEHTKLPWKSVRNTGVRNDGGYVVFSKAKPSHYPGQDERYEKEIAEWHGNLEYIALACNSHKDLVAALEQAELELCHDCSGFCSCKECSRGKTKSILEKALIKAEKA